MGSQHRESPNVANILCRKQRHKHFEHANKLLHNCSEWFVPSPLPPALHLTHSLLLDLTEGIDPTNSSNAQVYGGVPGNPADVYMQWVIVANSDNSIRYSSSPFLFSLVFLLLVLDKSVELGMLN